MTKPRMEHRLEIRLKDLLAFQAITMFTKFTIIKS